MLNEEQIKEFQFLFKRCFGEEITKEDALEQGTRLVNIMKLIYKPLPKKSYRRPLI